MAETGEGKPVEQQQVCFHGAETRDLGGHTQVQTG